MKMRTKLQALPAADHTASLMFWRRSEKAFDALISRALQKGVAGPKPSPETWNVIKQRVQNVPH